MHRVSKHTQVLADKYEYLAVIGSCRFMELSVSSNYTFCVRPQSDLQLFNIWFGDSSNMINVWFRNLPGYLVP